MENNGKPIIKNPNKPVISKDDALKKLIRSFIKKQLIEMGIEMNEYISQISTVDSEIILSRNEENPQLVDLGVKRTSGSGMVHYAHLRKEDIKKLIDNLQLYV